MFPSYRRRVVYSIFLTLVDNRVSEHKSNDTLAHKMALVKFRACIEKSKINVVRVRVRLGNIFTDSGSGLKII